MAAPKKVKPAAPLFRVLGADETVATAARTRAMSDSTKQAGILLSSLVSATPKGRKASVPTSAFPNVRQNESAKQKAQACRSFVKRWATKNGNPFSTIELAKDYTSLVITRSK